MANSRTIWITGASSGIGEALANLWAQAGTVLILSGRDTLQLERVAVACKKLGAEVHVLPFDLTNEKEDRRAHV